MPDRGLVEDAAYVASVVRAVEGPVVLVGRSCGGAAITLAGAEDDVRAPVYLAGHALEEGESPGRLPDALVHTPVPVPGSTGTGTDVSVAVDGFPAPLAADVGPGLAAVLAVSRRPLAAPAFWEAAPVAVWRIKPSWGLVAASDRTINPDVERYGYERAGTTTVEVDSSHLVMLARPKAVAELTPDVVRATGHRSDA